MTIETFEKWSEAMIKVTIDKAIIEREAFIKHILQVNEYVYSVLNLVTVLVRYCL